MVSYISRQQVLLQTANLLLNGISRFQKIYPEAEVQDLIIAYRQTAKLLKIASSIYEKILDVPAKFKPFHEEDVRDPEPLVYISDEDDDKLRWVVDRIIEIHNLYGTSFPTVALFVKNDNEVVRIAKLLKNYSALEESGIGISACVQGQILGNQEHVRVFSIEYIKGLEFGAVFFHDLDQLSDGEQDLINKFIYVGLSRANLFLGVTFMYDYPESISYLKPIFKESNWKIIN
jgi:DNA helicase IV